MGAEAIQALLKEIDLDQLSEELTAEVEKSSGQKMCIRDRVKPKSL